jgi:uncharacterized phage protein gp47/JayE
VQNYSVSQANETASNIVKNIFGVNRDGDLIIPYMEMLTSVILYAQNNAILQALQQTIIDSMSGIELDNEGNKYNVIRQQSSQSEGMVVFNITNPLAIIDIGTEFIANNNQYNATTTTAGQVITFGNGTQDLLITKIEVFASTKKAIVFCENHGLSKSIEIVGSGFSVAGLNGTQVITDFDKNSFTFTNDNIVSTTTVTTFLNTEFLTASIIKTNVRSVETGFVTNVARGGEVSVSTALQYINTTGYVDYNEIGLGADTETDDNYRARIVERKQTNGVVAEIETIVLNQAGVTRVRLVQQSPFIGNFTIYFLRDNDSDIIPTQQELDAIKTILTTDDNISPRITEDSVFVEAPTPVSRRFTISGLVPNSTIMQEAIRDQIQEIIYNNGIQDGTISTITDVQLTTLLIQGSQDSIGNIISAINTVVITDTLNAPATLSLNVGEFLTVDQINFV